MFALRGFRFPVGPDAPVYLWWTRLAAAQGLSTVERPGTIALVGVLRWIGVGLPAALAGLECALGAAVGLSSAALARIGGARRTGWMLAGALAGTFATHLVAGYVSNLVFAVVFLAALAVLDGGSRRAAVAAAVLLGAGGLAHPVFFVVGIAILLLAGALAFRANRAQTARAVAAALGAAGIVGVGELSLLAGPPLLQTDTSQDAFLRRAGLTDNLAHAYRDRLVHRWTRYAQWASLPLAAIGARRPAGWVRRALWAWVAVTVVGVAVGAASGRFPPDRFLTFGYAIPILASFGLLALVDRWTARRGLVLAAAVALAAAMIAGSGVAWLREKPYIGTQAVDAIRRASTYASNAAPGAPWVVPVDSPSTRISFLATRLQNVIRAAVPPDRIADVYVIAPPPPGGLSVTDEREWSALARLYARDAAEAARRAPAPVVIRVDAFEARGGRTPVCSGAVCAALARPTVPVGPGVSVSSDVAATTPVPPDDTLESSTARVLVAAPLVLLVLTFAGLGWALVVIGDHLVASALAPAFGTAALVLGGVVADRVGLRLSGAGPAALVFALASVGGLLVLLAQRRRRADAPQ